MAIFAVIVFDADPPGHDVAEEVTEPKAASRV